jgi:hypothetical protein
MQVEEATRPSAVIWTCLSHTGHPQWLRTTIVFELAQAEDDLSYAQSGEGSPF